MAKNNRLDVPTNQPDPKEGIRNAGPNSDDFKARRGGLNADDFKASRGVKRNDSLTVPKVHPDKMEGVSNMETIRRVQEIKGGYKAIVEEQKSKDNENSAALGPRGGKRGW